MRGVALGRKTWLFVGSEAGGRAATTACTLIEPAKLNGADPQVWLADALARTPDRKMIVMAGSPDLPTNRLVGAGLARARPPLGA